MESGKVNRIHFTNIDSTMTISEVFLKDYCGISRNASDQMVYLFSADQQNKGKGQHSNTWTSPPGNSYTTYLVRTRPELALFGPQLAALSVYSVLNEILIKQKDKTPNLYELKMKWINDVFLNNKKICGVLVRTETMNQ